MNAFSKTVHPHGRGDNATTHRLRKTTSGSPPRAWGQSPSDAEIRAFLRFTPTGVGTICASHSAGTTYPVHPHGRGDNFVVGIKRWRNVGSPPRAWGQLPQRPARQRVGRFTPTGVGTIETRRATRASAAVHPHGRGDNLVSAAQWVWSNGSPPRAWGQ